MKQFLRITLILGLFFCHGLSAQNNERDYLFARAQEEMQAENYEAANKLFRQLLRLGKQLPSEMPYLFAQTLYEIGQYKNSDSFLKKYFEVMGKGGTYYKQAQNLEILLENKLNKNVTCKLCDISGYVIETCGTCQGEKEIVTSCNYCQAVGKVGCEVCSGEGVIIEKNQLGANTYKTCQRCQGKGIHTCSICDGEKKYSRFCPTCLGSGVNSTNVLCTHPNQD